MQWRGRPAPRESRRKRETPPAPVGWPSAWRSGWRWRPARSRGGRPRGERRAGSSRRSPRPRRRQGRTLCLFPKQRASPAIRPRTASLMKPRFLAEQPRRARRGGGGDGPVCRDRRVRRVDRSRSDGARRLARRRRRPDPPRPASPTLPRSVRGGSVVWDLPQAAAPQLRRLRRAAVVRRPAPVHPYVLYAIGGRRPSGVTICEDVWYARRSGGGARARGKGGPRGEHQRRRRFSHGRWGERLRDAAASGSAKPGPLPPRLLQPGRRSGRTRLRRRGARSSSAPAGTSLPRWPRQFAEDLLVVDLAIGSPNGSRAARSLPVIPVSEPAPAARGARSTRACAEPLGPSAEIYEALVLGTRDYLGKNGFAEAVIALSGGIDSALVATVAVGAHGRRARARPVDAPRGTRARDRSAAEGPRRPALASTCRSSPSTRPTALSHGPPRTGLGPGLSPRA